MEQKERLSDLKSIEKQVNYRLRRYDVGQVIRVTWAASDGHPRNFIVRVDEVIGFTWSMPLKTVRILDLGELSGLAIYEGMMVMLAQILLLSEKTKIRKLSDKEALLYAL